MKSKTTKKGKRAMGIPIESVSPTGHEELIARHFEEQVGEDAATPLTPERCTHEHKPLQPDQKLNPKRKSADAGQA